MNIQCLLRFKPFFCFKMLWDNEKNALKKNIDK